MLPPERATGRDGSGFVALLGNSAEIGLMEKRGVLFKKGRGAIGTILSVATQWKPRYAILSPHEGTMRYYSDNSQSKVRAAHFLPKSKFHT
jgi:hypothetical protein